MLSDIWLSNFKENRNCLEEIFVGIGPWKLVLVRIPSKGSAFSPTNDAVDGPKNYQRKPEDHSGF